ncbi:MAG: hypothetical protein F6K26_38260 [Moorea sp. SIO2I5]|nr:hypothetical protein [Moorena sp. SIO2I5]
MAFWLVLNAIAFGGLFEPSLNWHLSRTGKMPVSICVELASCQFHFFADVE